MVASSSVASGASTIATNAIDGKRGSNMLDGVATAAIAGGVAGGVLGGGNIIKGGNTLTKLTLIGAGSGAASGATSSII
jgi:hypothetical protein